MASKGLRDGHFSGVPYEWQIKNFKSNDLGCVARKGVSGLGLLFIYYRTIIVNRCQEKSSQAKSADPGERCGHDISCPYEASLASGRSSWVSAAA